MSLSEDIKRKYPGRNVTHIEKLEVNFSQSSRDRDYASSGGVAVNFPLKLCFAATAHKVQGLTVKYPQSMILDMHCRLQCAMVYVMLSRVQSLSQLFILEGVPWEKVKPYQLAYAECERLTRVDMSLGHSLCGFSHRAPLVHRLATLPDKACARVAWEAAHTLRVSPTSPNC